MGERELDPGSAVPASGGLAATTQAAVEPPRVAIVGAGFMGRVHARAVRVAGGRLVGVTASSAARSEEASRAFGAERAFGDLDALLADDEVDLVHICTPNHLHARLAHAALAAGKHVVCEKPLATDAATTAALVDAAAGRTATVPFVYRFHPVVREARARVRDGAIGTVHLAHGSYLQDWLLEPGDDNWRVDPELGGPSRAFGDIGSHWCDLLEFVTGDRIARVSALTATVNPERGNRPVRTEDVVTVQFVTAAGVPGSCVISQVSAGRKNRLHLEVSGASGSLGFDQEDPERLWLGGRESSGYLVRDPDTLHQDAARYARVPAGHAQGYQDCFDAFVADTFAAIGGQMPDGLPTFADGHRAALIAEAVLTSAREERWTEVAP